MKNKQTRDSTRGQEATEVFNNNFVSNLKAQFTTFAFDVNVP